jgi:hypothetical protein
METSDTKFINLNGDAVNISTITRISPVSGKDCFNVIRKGGGYIDYTVCNGNEGYKAIKQIYSQLKT